MLELILDVVIGIAIGEALIIGLLAVSNRAAKRYVAHVVEQIKLGPPDGFVATPTGPVAVRGTEADRVLGPEVPRVNMRSFVTPESTGDFPIDPQH